MPVIGWIGGMCLTRFIISRKIGSNSVAQLLAYDIKISYSANNFLIRTIGRHTPFEFIVLLQPIFTAGIDRLFHFIAEIRV